MDVSERGTKIQPRRFRSGGRGGGAENTSPRTAPPTEEEQRTMARMTELRAQMDKLRLRKVQASVCAIMHVCLCTTVF